ncbi:MAG: hypothetical protein IT422_09595 [Pirellulaceae bacterium]|nr:hypothetical protein [Pirellulaceae bacterium]
MNRAPFLFLSAQPCTSMPHPADKSVHNAIQQAAIFRAKLGFTPSARAKVNDSFTGAATFMIRDL